MIVNNFSFILSFKIFDRSILILPQDPHSWRCSSCFMLVLILSITLCEAVSLSFPSVTLIELLVLVFRPENYRGRLTDGLTTGCSVFTDFFQEPLLGTSIPQILMTNDSFSSQTWAILYLNETLIKSQNRTQPNDSPVNQEYFQTHMNLP